MVRTQVQEGGQHRSPKEREKEVAGDILITTMDSKTKSSRIKKEPVVLRAETGNQWLGR